MFEKLKFNKKFYLLKSYIKDKELIEEVLYNNRFMEFYENNCGDIASFISNLEKIYKSEQISNILSNLVKHFYGTEFKKSMENLESYIFFTNKYNDKSLDILKGLSFDYINKTYSYNIKNEVLNLCFKKHYKEKNNSKRKRFYRYLFFYNRRRYKGKITFNFRK